jgi:hypothetical protein
MRFAEPINFIILLGVVALGVFIFWALARKKKLINLFGDLPLIFKNAPYISFARQRTKVVILLVALMLLSVVLARLQFGTHKGQAGDSGYYRSSQGRPYSYCRFCRTGFYPMSPDARLLCRPLSVECH